MKLNRLFAVTLVSLFAVAVHAAEQPNILWISIEDTSPWFGFCGEKYAKTPNLDALARRGVYYNNAFATAPVCAPCRYAIITGTYATSYGTQRLRSDFPIPDSITGFPAFLRKAGYYCTNNSKTDYNTSAAKRLIAESWDECSGKAHYKNRKPGQPFFAVFNLMETHQGKIFEATPAPNLDPSEQHDPAKAPIPPYYPDTPVAHRVMARVHDCITAVDKRADAILAELEQAGLKDDTIVFFWPDHGQGIPRGKRTLWDTGMKVPLVVYVPDKFRHLATLGRSAAVPAVSGQTSTAGTAAFLKLAPGSTCDRLVSLMDLGPTLLSLLDLPIPSHMQSRAFLGKAATAPRKYVFGARDRVDEVSELSRSVRDKRYLYIRNFMPDLSWNQPETFSDQLDLRREITKLAAEGKLNAAQLTYAAPTKPVELLYDTDADPWQINNLAGEPKYRAELERLRKALRDWQTETRDIGLMHETEAARGTTDFPVDRVLDTAWRVGLPGEVAELTRRLSDPNPTVRYWAVIGLRVAGAKDGLQKLLADESSPVRIEAAGVLVALDVLTAAINSDDENVQVHAARTLQLLGEKARPALPAMQAALPKIKNMFARWAIQGAIANLTGTENLVFKPRAKAAPKKKQRPPN